MPTTQLDEADPVVDVETAPPQGAPCQACGCPVEPEDQFCPACGFAHQTPLARREQQEEAQRRPRNQFRCENCGAHVETDPDQLSYTCAFCDSTYVVQVAADESPRQPPEFIIGFRVTHEQALARFRQWIRENNWFRPGDLHHAQIEEKLVGVYLPFWSFSMLAQSRWSANIGEYWYRTETYTTTNSKGKTVTKTRRVRKTEWWDLSGRHHRYYAGHLVSGAEGLPQREADRIKPFQLPAMKRFAPYYLAGWLSEQYSVEREEALRLCRQEFQNREQENVAAFLPGDTYRQLCVNTDFRHVNSDLCLLPVYMLSYRYRDKLYRFLVNGQTGRAAGDKPLSWRRILAAAGIGLFALVFLFAMFYLLAGR